MNYKNLTPHTINIYNAAHELVLSVEPSGAIARIATKKTLEAVVDGVEFYTTEVTGEPQGLPPKEDSTICIVSGIFRSFVDRDDMMQPGELLRDEQGRPIGCVGLSR